MSSYRFVRRGRASAMSPFVMLALLFCMPCSSAVAGIVVPAGATVSLNGGSMDLGDSSLAVAGTVQVDSGQLLGVRDVTVAVGGQLSTATGLIELSGDWQVFGSFSAGIGEVRFVDGMSSVWNVFGSTQFASLSLISTIGKRFVVEPDSTQRIAQLLTITGTAAQPLQIARQPAGPVGRFDLQPSGSQSIMHVGVSDVHAVGQPLAPTLSNEGGSGNATGWFGSVAAPPAVPVPTMIPATSPIALLLIFLLVLTAARIAGSGVANPR